MKLFSLLLFLLIGLAAGAQTASLTVIGNPKGVPTTLKEPELKAILKGERQRWHSGYKIIIALMKTDTDIGRYTSEKVYNMTADELKKYWLAQVFQGKAEAPIFFNNASELETFVADNPGAIGIVDQAPPTTSTQVVMIDGRKVL